MIRYPCIKKYKVIRGIGFSIEEGYIVLYSETSAGARRSSYKEVKQTYKMLINGRNLGAIYFRKGQDGLWYIGTYTVIEIL